MIRINCPWCGPRDQHEFTYGGDASKKRPADPENAGPEAWYEFVYLRDNPRGPLDEYWHHVGGCRQWLVVRRDTLAHEVLEVRAPHEAKARPKGRKSQ